MRRSIFSCLLSGAGILFMFAACRQVETKGGAATAADPNALFVLLPPDSTHIMFNNQLTEGLNTNVLMYEYFYNGGGVAVGDMNGDGLQDIYFTGNMTDNKLYLNRGHLRFQDITQEAGVAGRPGPWKTGVAVADVNGDGRPDIFVCYSGKVRGAHRMKQLFINQGNDASGIPQFNEQAEQYGLADSSYTTQAYFFDYDKDGDLDLLLLNHNPNNLPVLNEMSTAAIMRQQDPLCGVRLYRNDAGHFRDVTAGSGLNSSQLSYGLGAGIADIDGDGWQDIYISNDYAVPDAYYVNDHKGGFVNRLSDEFGHISQFSMGNNVADVNNDGLPDVFTLDMLPEDNRRQKLLFAPDNYEKFDLNVRSGFHYQYMRNMLQLNDGNGHFSEIGQLAGISNTDWSWAPLWADLDNDGWKDLFVTNGYVRDFTNMDFIKFMDKYTQTKGRLRREDVLEIIDHMPSSNVHSYFFHNNGDLSFTNTSEGWGIRQSSNSNGAAWVDLDNDGDLDLVVNNLNLPAFVYENRGRQQNGHHYLQVRLEGDGLNTAGVGAKLTLYSGGRMQYLEQMPQQGYQSTVSTVLHFGLGKDSVADSLRVVWPSGRQQVIARPVLDKDLVVQEKEAAGRWRAPAKGAPVLFEEAPSPLAYKPVRAAINDYKRQPLLVNPLSFSGPCLVKGDVNEDGLEDVYVGGDNGQAGTLFLQQRDGRFAATIQPAFQADKARVDADGVMLDANGDGHMDLYVASGGYHQYHEGDSLLEDRLYIGDGRGRFVRSRDALPVMTIAKGCVRAADVNGDGHPDLFVGGRSIPGQYPVTPASYLLINDGKGHFKDEIAQLAPGLAKIGMVTDAVWADMNKDGQADLVVAGEWMPVSVFVRAGQRLEDRTADYFDKPCRGWWNKLWVGDLNGDGRMDVVAGNLGTNTQCKVDEKHPAELYYKDLDGNGTIDPFLCFFVGDSSWPFSTRDELLQQVGNMSKQFPDYRTYADARIGDIFGGVSLESAGKLEANCLRTCLFVSGSDGRLHNQGLPVQAQYSPVWTITPLDFNGDGKQDLLLCGNINHARLRFGKYDANYGCLLEGDGKGHFRYVSQRLSGFHLQGDVRSVVRVGSTWLFGVNQEGVRAYREKVPEKGTGERLAFLGRK